MAAHMHGALADRGLDDPCPAGMDVGHGEVTLEGTDSGNGLLHAVDLSATTQQPGLVQMDMRFDQTRQDSATAEVANLSCLTEVVAKGCDAPVDNTDI